ncbi:MAG: HAMP domain-containing protein [Chloroflexi bacterium]|nr:HAMP domain-containing protein [Chloroflexota bacterium]
MTTPIRTRLVLSYLVILALGMALAGILAWRSVEALYLQTQQKNLLAQAEITAEALRGQPLPNTAAEPYSQALNVMPGIHSRVLGEQGTVIIGLPAIEKSSQLQAPPAENQAYISSQELIARPEIEQALQGRSSTAIRKVTTAQNQRVLYAAAPILADDGSVTGLVYLAMPLPASGIPDKLLLNFILAGLAASLLVLSFGIFTAQRIAKPIENIASIAGTISTGNLNQKANIDTGIKEMNDLGKSFNVMTESLLQADQIKNAFVADVTHELRTPLTVIKGTVETLEDGAIDDIEGRTSLLASMAWETDRLIRLVNDLLVLTRADASMLNLQIQMLDLRKLVRERCQHFGALASCSHVHIEMSESDSKTPVIVEADSDRLAQVLDNLLDNAIRYSPPGSEIIVEVWRDDEVCHCSVHDCGPGIPGNHLPHIFERFYRADPSRNRQTGGVGLGLAIARALVIAHGGQIDAESAPSQGTTLRFWLPAAKNTRKMTEN